MTYCGSEVGKNCHELLIAPKPDSNPRKTVPMTTSRERYAEKVPEDFSDEGTGMYERAKRYNPIVANTKMVRRKEMKRFRGFLGFGAGPEKSEISTTRSSLDNAHSLLMKARG